MGQRRRHYHSAAEMRSKSCPIVTFQTERKGIGFEFLTCGTRQETHMCAWRSRSCARPPGVNMVNPNLRYCALELRCWGREKIRAAVGRHISTVYGSKLRHSCNRFQRLSNGGHSCAGTAESFWLPN